MSQPIEVGPYRVLRRLGEGGMAETFVAERTGPGGFVQRVCLKRVRHGMDQDAEFVRQFQAEARIMATLQHATIVQVLDFGEAAGAHYLALELVDGLDLRQLLDASGPLDLRTVLHLAIQLSTALDIAHRSGVVHRDISPSNVLLNAEGEVRLTDFGIARALSETRQTRTGIVKGKYPYMAPEYVGTGELDARSDLFGLGVLLYECLAGRRPYDGGTEIETLARAATGVHVPLSEAAATNSNDGSKTARTLFSCVERMLRPAPDERQQSAADVLETLTAEPGDGQVARHIGQLVRTHRTPPDEDDDGPAAQARSHAGDTAPLLPAPELRTPSTARAADHGSRTALRTWLVVGAIGIAAGLIGGLLVLAPGDGSPATPGAGPVDGHAAHLAGANRGQDPRVPSSTLEATTAPAAASPQARTTDGEAPDAAVADGRGAQSALSTLSVVVIPYGDVVIDGKQYGPAPVRARLEPGKHTIVAQLAGRSARRQVTLSPGATRRVVIR